MDKQTGCSNDQYYLQTPVVVEYCFGCYAVFELIEIRLQLASMKHFAKNKAACKVLQGQQVIECRSSLAGSCGTRDCCRMRVPSRVDRMETGLSGPPQATPAGAMSF